MIVDGVTANRHTANKHSGLKASMVESVSENKGYYTGDQMDERWRNVEERKRERER